MTQLMIQLVCTYSVYIPVQHIYQPFLHVFFLLDSPQDYFSSTGSLTINTGNNRICHDVEIVNDDICEEPSEQFFSDLTLVSGASVTIDPASVRVVIFDDPGDCVRK